MPTEPGSTDALPIVSAGVGRTTPVGNGTPAPASLRDHFNSDVDQHPGAHHHTLGPGPNNAAPGNHTHPGGTSVTTLFNGDTRRIRWRDLTITNSDLIPGYSTGSNRQFLDSEDHSLGTTDENSPNTLQYDGSKGPAFIRFDAAGVYAFQIAAGKLSRALNAGEYIEFAGAYWDSDPLPGWFGVDTYDNFYLTEFSPNTIPASPALSYSFKPVDKLITLIVVEPSSVGTYIGVELGNGHLDSDITLNLEFTVMRVNSWDSIDAAGTGPSGGSGYTPAVDWVRIESPNFTVGSSGAYTPSQISAVTAANIADYSGGAAPSWIGFTAGNHIELSDGHYIYHAELVGNFNQASEPARWMLFWDVTEDPNAFVSLQDTGAFYQLPDIGSGYSYADTQGEIVIRNGQTTAWWVQLETLFAASHTFSWTIHINRLGDAI
jgi:hypothetical protein